jgi:uncharacterized protein (TIGR03083 family)
MRPVEPIDTVELFPGLSRELLSVLRRCPPAGWSKPTACPSWSVKDVAAHLLGGNLGRLPRWAGIEAERRPVCEPIAFAELVTRINARNAEWVEAARSIGPDVLVDLLEVTDVQLYEHFKTLPADAPAGAAVAWAGESESPWWFDIAREYTEKWLHQQHIREALGEPILAQRRWLFPVLDTFMRALPYTYRDVRAPDGTIIDVSVRGEAGGEWLLRAEAGAWRLYVGPGAGAVCRVEMDQDLAWRLFTKGISRERARAGVTIQGDVALGEKALDMVSIMA